MLATLECSYFFSCGAKYTPLRSVLTPPKIRTIMIKIKPKRTIISKARSSHQRCFVKKGILRNFAKLTGKSLCQGLFFNISAA